jgi:hypothetical protein
MKIIKYNNTLSKDWNRFIEKSKNGTFLFNRDYMDYHSDRFHDYSLLVYNEKKQLIALLPASLHGKELVSHGGLTYGGFITNHTMKSENMLNIFKILIKFLLEDNIQKLIYKVIPHIYHKAPSEEDLYSLFIFGARLYRRDVSSVINMRTTNIKGQKVNGYKKAIRSGLSLAESNNSMDILDITNNNLLKKYQTSAVHTSNEMNELKRKFPKNIRIYNLLLEGDIEGGAILYVSNNTVHAQYVATSDKAKIFRGLDFIIVSIFEKYRDEFEWFDFGISTENSGKNLNNRLLKSKEDFNMSAVCYDFYELEIQ